MTNEDAYALDPDAVARPLGDPLGEILHLLKLTGTFYCQSRLSAPWGVAAPAFEGVMSFVLVASGRCWLMVEGEPPLLIEEGGFALMTRGAPHSLRSDPDAPDADLETLPVRQVTPLYETLEYGGGGETTALTYGIVRIDHAAGGMLRELLPDVLKIDAWRDEAGGWLRETMRFIAREARELRPGGETVITRLADVVVVEAIRRWLATAPEADRGWLKGVRDPQIGRAVIAVHRAPAEEWTVESLAKAAGMSRSAFSGRFSELVGTSAMRYLTLWRMQLARTTLLENSQSLAAIAEEVGYHSEPAFCRAFKRVFRETPGEVRARGRGG